MILVTGAKGSVGSVMAKYLAEQGENVVATDIIPGEVAGCIFEVCDLSKEEEVNALFAKYDFTAIVHLAAILYTVSNNEPDKGFKTNILGSYNLLKANQDKKAKFIYGSSIDIYGSVTGSKEEPVAEVTIPDPNNFYAISKMAPERMGDAMGETFGFTFITARIPVMLGEGQASPNSMWRERVFTSVKDGEHIDFANKEQYPAVPVSHVDDTVKSIYTLIQRDAKYSLYNLPCETMTMLELANAVHEANDKVTFRFGTKDKPNICPEYVDCSRFIQEFDYKLVPMAEQIKAQK